MKQLLPAVVLIGFSLSLVSGCKPAATRDAESDIQAVTKSPIAVKPDISITSLDGADSLSISELTGSQSLLYFFGPWTDSGASATQWMKDFNLEGIRVIPVVLDARSPDQQPTIPGIDSFNLSIYRSSPQLLEAVGGIRALPTAVLLGTTGEVVQRWSGYTAITAVVAGIQTGPMVKLP